MNHIKRLWGHYLSLLILIAFLAYPIYEPDQILSIIASIEDSFYKQDALEKFAAALPKLTPSQSFPLTGWCR